VAYIARRGGEAPRLGALEQKIIRAKVGLLELAKRLGNVSQSLQDDGLQPRQLLQGALRARANWPCRKSAARGRF